MLQHRWPCKKTNMIALHELSKGVRFIGIKKQNGGYQGEKGDF